HLGLRRCPASPAGSRRSLQWAPAKSCAAGASFRPVAKAVPPTAGRQSPGQPLRQNRVAAMRDASSQPPALEVRNLSKIYRSRGGAPAKTALKSINLEVKRGSFFGLLGPNGAGKSTLINIVAGLVRKTSGDVFVCGYDHEKEMRLARSSVGV